MRCAITSLLCSPCNIISSRFSWPTWNTVNLYWPTVAANRFLKAANTYGITDATDMSWTQQAATFRNMHQFLPIHPHCLCWGFSMTYCIVVPVRKKKITDIFKLGIFNKWQNELVCQSQSATQIPLIVVYTLVEGKTFLF